MANFNDELLAVLEDPEITVSVVSGAISGRGILEDVDVVVADEKGRAQVIGKDRSVLVARSQFGSLKVGAAITVDSKNYTVRDRGDEQDPAVTRLFLKGQ